MPNALRPKINQLVDKLEEGKLSVHELVRQVARLGVPKSGVGALIGKRQPKLTLTNSLVRTGVLVKIQMDENNGTVVEGVVRPGAVEFAQVVRSSSWSLKSNAPSIAVKFASRKELIRKDDTLRIRAGQTVRFTNPTNRTVRFIARQPAWEPADYAYQYHGRRISGSEMWFELKTSANDRKRRPMYNVISAGGKGNFVLATVEAGTETIRCYYTDSDYVITGITGIGKVEIETTRGKKSMLEIVRGTRISVKKQAIFRVINDHVDTLVVEIRSVSARRWTPESSYFDVVEDKFSAGDQVYFEFVIPT